MALCVRRLRWVPRPRCPADQPTEPQMRKTLETMMACCSGHRAPYMQTFEDYAPPLRRPPSVRRRWRPCGCCTWTWRLWCCLWRRPRRWCALTAFPGSPGSDCFFRSQLRCAAAGSRAVKRSWLWVCGVNAVGAILDQNRSGGVPTLAEECRRRLHHNRGSSMRLPQAVSLCLRTQNPGCVTVARVITFALYFTSCAGEGADRSGVTSWLRA